MTTFVKHTPAFILHASCDGEGCDGCHDRGGRVVIDKYDDPFCSGGYRTRDGRFTICKSWVRGRGNFWQIEAQGDERPFRGFRMGQPTRYCNVGTLREARDELAELYMNELEAT
jgi:hypothetical protein